METAAEPAPELDYTPQNWVAEFGKDGIVETPIGKIKMGEHQFIKLFNEQRTKELGMIKPTLINPDVILEKNDPQDDAERDTKYLFIKSFKYGNKTVKFFTSITVKKSGMEVVVSNHIQKENQLRREFEKGTLLWSRFNDYSDPLGEKQDLDVNTAQDPNDTSHSSNSQSKVASDKYTEKIQKDKKGNLLFEQSEPQDTYDYLLDAYESDTELLPVVDKKIADLEKKIGTRPADIDKVQKWKEAKDLYSKDLTYWRGIKEMAESRIAEQKQAAKDRAEQERVHAETDLANSANPDTPPEMLAELADNQNSNVRLAVAKNPSTPAEVLDKLSKSSHSEVRAAVARNHNTPPETLAKLANTNDAYGGLSVKISVAANPNTPAK